MTQALQNRLYCPSCGSRYRWKAALAHHKVRCQICRAKLRFPREPHGEVEVLEPPREHGGSDESGVLCLSCNKEISLSAMVCVHCGYDLEHHRALHTEVEPPVVIRAGEDNQPREHGPRPRVIALDWWMIMMAGILLVLMLVVVLNAIFF